MLLMYTCGDKTFSEAVQKQKKKKKGTNRGTESYFSCSVLKPNQKNRIKKKKKKKPSVFFLLFSFLCFLKNTKEDNKKRATFYNKEVPPLTIIFLVAHLLNRIHLKPQVFFFYLVINRKNTVCRYLKS